MTKKILLTIECDELGPVPPDALIDGILAAIPMVIHVDGGDPDDDYEVLINSCVVEVVE